MRKLWVSRVSVFCAAMMLISCGTAISYAQTTDSAPAVVKREPLTKGPAKRVIEEAAPERVFTCQSFYLTFSITPSTGAWQIKEKMSHTQNGQVWASDPKKPFGRVSYQIDDKFFTSELTTCDIEHFKGGLKLTFHPVENIQDMDLSMLVMPLSNHPALNFSVHPSQKLKITSLTLFENAFPVTSNDLNSGVIIPVREGIFVPANTAKTFEKSFTDSDYEGCHMRLWGLQKNNTAAFLTWSDPGTTLGITSKLVDGQQVITTSITQQTKPQGFTFNLCGTGDFNNIAERYRVIAQKNGLVETWATKAAEHTGRQKLFGATNYKLWCMIYRQMDEASKEEKSCSVNWTFEEAVKVAEHLKNDLKMDDVLFTMGGWINRGYDNQHPDVLPAAPECGGNFGLRQAVWGIQNLGYTACLHDNYQDIYKDSPSWDEKLLAKNQDGSIRMGGVWAGGRAYIVCSQESYKLAQRPQNLPAIKRLTQAHSYFIDTTYAAGLSDCYDKMHPITRQQDIEWKQMLSDYARETFGVFGSEDGREWAIPHADFFEGITGVSGKDYHNLNTEEMGAVLLPIFEMVYHDCIAAYGKYGYDINKTAPYVLRHISMGRPMHHHDVPVHLYWENFTPAEYNADPVAMYAQANGGWAEGMHPYDIYVKNAHEILSPLNKITAEMKLTRFDYLSADKTVTRSIFQKDNDTVIVFVNYGDADFRTVSDFSKKDIVLGQYGFTVESRDFVAFNAKEYDGKTYETPSLFTLKTLTKDPVWNSTQVQVFHGFGESQLSFNGDSYTVEKEAVISTTAKK